MSFNISIPTADGHEELDIKPGNSIVFVGANGTGKTRLAVHLEADKAETAHRISAHRALTMNPGVPKITEIEALQRLRIGQADSVNNPTVIQYRDSQRWGQRPAVSLLNDFDFLLQALFADQSNKALATHNRVRAGGYGPANPTNLEILKGIWERLHSHRRLVITGDDIKVVISDENKPYSASEMSDGERATFYLLGQALTAAKDSLLIVDEPELHLHPSIIAKLWDEIEGVRPDCAFVFITHDLGFAASRACTKYVISQYEPTPFWTIEKVNADEEFSEELSTLILGSRKPILFIEGEQNSLDLAVYRCCYPDWTVIPKGSCEEVIHSVVSMRKSKALTRITCAGIVDADDYETDDKVKLQRLGISVLPVSEIENVFLLPEVSKVIAQTEDYEEHDLNSRLQDLKQRIFSTLDTPEKIEAVVVRYCRRRIDRQLKKIDLSDASTIEGLMNEFKEKTEELSIQDIASKAKRKIKDSIENADLTELLKIYDNKGLMKLAATYLKQKKQPDFEGWITRSLRKQTQSDLISVIQNVLPNVTAK